MQLLWRGRGINQPYQSMLAASLFNAPFIKTAEAFILLDLNGSGFECFCITFPRRPFWEPHWQEALKDNAI